VSLAFDDGRRVGRVRRWRTGWESHYDPNGLDRAPAEPMGARVDEGRRLGAWASADEAQRAVQRYRHRPSP
jgi:hypothetical protein